MKSQLCLFIIAIFQSVTSLATPIIANVGQACGGSSGAFCEPGLTCNDSGICSFIVRAGEKCGGEGLDAPICSAGLSCSKLSEVDDTKVCQVDDATTQ